MAVEINSERGIVAASGWDKTVRLWRLADGDPAGPSLVHDSSNVQDLDFSRDGRWLLTTSAGTIRLWSLDTFERIGPSFLTDPSSAPWETRFSPDETKIVVADHQNGAFVVNLPSNFDAPHPDPRLWIEVLTQMQMDDQGAVTWIPRQILQEKRAALAALVGSTE